MLLFGHLGITLAAALVSRRVYFALSKRGGIRGARIGLSGGDCRGRHEDPRNGLSEGLFDLRFWMLGSILPDLIDKPLGHYLFSQYFGGNGRIYGHTLLFTVLILVTGYFLYSRKSSTWLLALGFGALMHLILDYSWQSLFTSFWPLLGVSFPASSEGDWISGMIQGLVKSPGVYIPEIVGFIILAWFGGCLVLRREVRKFLKTGERSGKV